MTAKTADEIKEKLKPKKPQKKELMFLSTSSTLLNLAMSGKMDGGIPIGSYVLFNGDSQSGKTIVSNGCLAEAAVNYAFDGYDLIFNNPENGLLLDVQSFFGPRLVERISHPVGPDGEIRPSGTVEEFYYHLDDLRRKGKPFVEVLDSQDSLTSMDAEEKFQEEKKAYAKGREVTGSYGMSKPKKHSQNLGWVNSHLEKTGSILIIINQTRDNIGFGAQFNPRTRSGGRALKFFAQFELWSRVIKQLHKTVNGKDRQIGTLVEIHVKKNRVSGHDVAVQMPILRKHGLDDVGSLVDYLVEEKHWKTEGKKSEGEKESKVIVADDLDLSGKREKLIEQIQERDMDRELKIIAQKVWNEIDAQCELRRKPRYT